MQNCIVEASWERSQEAHLDIDVFLGVVVDLPHELIVHVDHVVDGVMVYLPEELEDIPDTTTGNLSTDSVVLC